MKDNKFNGNIDELVTAIVTAHAKTIPQQKKSKRGFSDIMYIVNMIFVVLITITGFGLMFMSAFVMQIDLSPLSVIVPAAYGELGLHTGFIIWKAKTENIHKYPDIQEINDESTAIY